MADEEAVRRLRGSVERWNAWKSRLPPRVTVDLDYANLQGAELSFADLAVANLRGANLRGANLTRADLSDTDLSDADLTTANLGGAILIGALLLGTTLAGARLIGSDVTGAFTRASTFGTLDLRDVRGLEAIRHLGPSVVGIDTLYQSAGEIPERFLRGCGVPEDMIAYARALAGTAQAINVHSCFISYSSTDEEFARRLHARLQREGVRIWFAPEDMKGGERILTQVDRALELHDRLLLVLSEASIASPWVTTELRRAIRQGERERRQKLFPIRVVPIESLREWECFDADSGRDFAAEVRQFHIPDFSNWKDHDAFEAAFARLLRDLRAAEGKAT